MRTVPTLVSAQVASHMVPLLLLSAQVASHMVPLLLLGSPEKLPLVSAPQEFSHSQK
jgi:hypothetical protein